MTVSWLHCARSRDRKGQSCPRSPRPIGCSVAALSQARPFFEQALRLDATNVEAMVGIADLDRNLATAHGWIGLGKCNLGRAEETGAHIMEAFRLSPRDTKASSWMNTAGVAQSYLGADEAAARWFKRSIEVNRNIAPFVHFFLAAALARLGQGEDAWAEKTTLIVMARRSTEKVHFEA